MSTTPEYDELLPLIQAIQPAGVLIPNMPVAVFIQEAEPETGGRRNPCLRQIRFQA